ncbi:polysaccharide biosynthesis tyrosine autokinase [Trinickia violacea]|uniref:Putative tyrosine-protein kinase EpsB n=2 Tax=Trinickia violacea TaxID=2571746 RepID=A0A4V1EHE7_9BURK|nr:polysaccharide biosynthesis tyrosine autokinase [Trinickia violacea]
MRIPGTAMNVEQTSISSSVLAGHGDLPQMLDLLVRHWRTIAITTGVCLLLGGVIALTSPIYQANLLLRVEDQGDVPSTSKPELLSIVSPSFDAKSNAEAEMQVIRSRLIVANAVDKLKLDLISAPHRFPLIGAWLARHNTGLSKPGLLGLGGYAWGEEQIDVDTFDVPRKLEGRPFAVTALTGGRYELSGSDLASPVTGTVGKTETFKTKKGDLTLRVERIVAAPGIRFDLKRASRQDAIDEIQKRLQVVEQGDKSNVLNVSMRGSDPEWLSGTLNAIGDEYVSENNDRNATIAANSLTFLEHQLPAMKAEMEAAEHRYNAYRNSNTLVDASEEGRLIMQRIADAEVQLLNLQRTRAELADRYTPSHPIVVAVDNQIALTQQYLNNQKTRMKAMPLEEQGALGLMRDVRVTTELYSTVRNNIEELRLVQASKAGFAQVIDRAEAPEHPVRPIASLIVFASALLGLFAGVAITYVRQLLIAGVTEPEEVEARTGLMVYAMVPHSAKQHELDRRAKASEANDLILAHRYPRDPTVESLRSFRSALQFALQGAPNNIVMLAGPLPQVGKSFVAANLALIMAMAGKRVLLVDGDLRKGTLHRSFGLETGAGLAEVLADPTLFPEVIRRDVLPNLDILMCGTYPPNPSELLNGTVFDNLMHKASAQYDIVLLDSAPALAVSDAGIIAPCAGSVFLVARFSETRISEIEETTKRFAQTGARVCGVMLNGFTMQSMKYLHPGRYGSHAYIASHYNASAK